MLRQKTQIILLWLGFFHEMMRKDRDDFVDLDYKAMEQYEIAKYGIYFEIENYKEYSNTHFVFGTNYTINDAGVIFDWWRMYG